MQHSRMGFHVHCGSKGEGVLLHEVGAPEVVSCMVPAADLKQAKTILAARIIAVPDDRGLSVRKAGALPRFAAVDFSRIRNADF